MKQEEEDSETKSCSYEGKWLDSEQDFPVLSGKFLGLIQGPPLPVGGALQSCSLRGETLVLPAWGLKSQGGNRGVAILVPHPPFPTLKGRLLWELGLS